MSTRFAILLRHGAYHQKPGTPSALQPFGLTAAGKAQARDAGLEVAQLSRLNGWKLATDILCSRLLRAWQTGEEIRKSLTGEVQQTFELHEVEELAERSVGSLANLTIPEIEQVLESDPRTDLPPEDWKSNSFYKLPVQGAESLMQAGDRVASVLRHRTRDLPCAGGPNARVFVGHGAALRHAAHHLGVLAFDDIRRLSMHHAKPVVLRFENDRWSHHCGDWKERRVLESATD